MAFGDKMNEALTDQAQRQEEGADPQAVTPADSTAGQPSQRADQPQDTTPPKRKWPHKPYVPVAVRKAQRAAAQRVLDEARAARDAERRAKAPPPSEADAFAEQS